MALIEADQLRKVFRRPKKRPGLAGSVRHLVETLEVFRHYNVEFISLRESIDTGSPLGAAVFTIIAAIAQLERSLIAERVKAGLRRARAEGKRIGRPRLVVDQRQLQQIASQRLSIRAAAQVLGISPSSYLRLLRAHAGASSSGSENGLRF